MTRLSNICIILKRIILFLERKALNNWYTVYRTKIPFESFIVLKPYFLHVHDRFAIIYTYILVVGVIALQRYWRINKAEYYFSQTNCRIIKMAPESTWNNATGYSQTLFSGIYHRRIIEGPLAPFRAKLCDWFRSALTGRHRNKLPAEEAWRHIEVNN